MIAWGLFALNITAPPLIGSRPLTILLTTILNVWLLTTSLVPAMVLPLAYRRVLLGLPAWLLLLAPMMVGLLISSGVSPSNNPGIGLAGYLLLFYGSLALLIDLGYKALRHDQGMPIIVGASLLVVWMLVIAALATHGQMIELILAIPGQPEPWASLRATMGWLLNLSILAACVGLVGWVLSTLKLIWRELHGIISKEPNPFS